MTKQKALTLCAFYFVGYLFLFPLFEMIVLDVFQSEMVYRFLNAFEWTFYLGFPMLMIKQVSQWLRKEIAVFFESPIKNLLSVLKTYLLMMTASIAFNLILMLVFQLENSGNQSQLIEMYAAQPFKVLYASLIFAPIVEELVFRGALFAPFLKNNRILGYFVSSFAFGLLHVYQSIFSGNYSDLLFLFSYALLGSYMCKAYDETNSMFSSMLLHFINNLISVILTFMI